jgi:hypothetical protein
MNATFDVIGSTVRLFMAAAMMRSIDFHAVRGSEMQVLIGGAKGFQSPLCQIQEPKFISESSRLFGLVFREAGPVVPSTFEVVATKVA